MVFRITAGVVAFYHLLLGLVCLCLPAAALGGWVRVFLGVDLEFDQDLLLIGKFSAAYVLVFGVMMALLCIKPKAMSALVLPALILFAVRLANKLVFIAQIEETLGVSRGRSVFAVVSLGLFFVLLAWSRPKPDTVKQSS